jgi:hypothetical protein
MNYNITRIENEIGALQPIGLVVDKPTKLFDITQIESEIGALRPIGLVVDKPAKLFDIIANIQTGSNRDFQFLVSKNLFTAKLDNNARAATHTIRIHDILNIYEVEIDMNNDLYATIVDIGYAMNYRNNEPARYINDRYKADIKNRNNYDKTYKNDTLMYAKSAAIEKSDYLIDFFRNIHPSINNIQIKAIKTLQLYDVIHIDLRVPIEERNKVSMFAGVLSAGFDARDRLGGAGFAVSPAWKEETRYRNFGGVIKGKVMSVEHDIVMGIMTLGITKV